MTPDQTDAPMRVVAIRIPDHLKAQIEREAKRNFRSISQQVGFVLSQAQVADAGRVPE